MRSLYLRIWLTVLAVLAVFALGSSWLWQRHLEQERTRLEQAASDRIAAWADLIQRSLPPAGAPVAEQAAALRDWSFRLRLPMALADANGQRIAASEFYERLEAEGFPRRPMNVHLDDGRTLSLVRPGLMGRMLPPEARAGSGPGGWGPPPRFEGMGPRGPGGPVPGLGEGLGGERPHGPPGMGLRPRPEGFAGAPPSLPFGLSPGGGLAAVLGTLFVLMGLASYPVIRGLTRRLEELKRGVEAFGGGSLAQRVPVRGHDEVAAVAESFNQAAQYIERLVQSHKSLLANASHELRSPLARLRMAVSLYEDAGPAQRAQLKAEIEANVTELDGLVEEVLLASRLDNVQTLESRDPVDLAGIAAEEASRVGARVECADAAEGGAVARGDERLLRRALRNLLENARRYGGGEIDVDIVHAAGGWQVHVCDRGPGVPEAFRERIFEAFFRMPGHAEREGGVGLGLSLVRQIAVAHGGSVRCEPREGGGSRFVLALPSA